MADETYTITIKGGVDGKIATSLREIAIQALAADDAVDLLRNTLRGFSAANAFSSARSDVREFRNEVNRAAQTQKTFATSTDAVKASLNGASGAASRYANDLKKIEGANATLGRNFNNLRGIVGNFAATFGGIFAIQQYSKAQDALTGMQNKIRSLTGDMERQADIQQRLFDLANKTRAGVEATTDGFVRFSKAMRGASDDEVLRFVETLNKSLISAGRSTAEVNSVVIQLGQALTSGRLMGDEFRSLSENLPYEALEAFAKQLGVGVDQLKALSSEGMITTEVIREAFKELATSIDGQFARTIPTISQALQVLNNQFIEFTANSSTAAGFLAQSIMFIADNLNIVIPAIGLFAAAWAGVQVAKLIGEIITFSQAIVAFGGALATANAPMLLLIGSVAALVAVFLAVTGQLEPFMDWLTNDLPKAIGGWIGKIGEASTANSGLTASLESTQTAADATNANLVKLFTDATANSATTTSSVDDLSGSFVQLNAMTATSAQSFMQFGNTGTAAATNVGNAITAVDSAAASATTTVSSLGSTAVEAFDAGSEAADTMTDALSRTEEQGNIVLDILKTIGDWASSALSAIQSVINAANSVADAVDTFTGAKRSSSKSADDTPGFYKGGSFMVNGSRGVDKNLVRFNASNGERVDILTPKQQRQQAAAMRGATADNGGGPPVFIFNIQTPDADSFLLSQQQLANSTFAAVS